jgi:hypothetical protein
MSLNAANRQVAAGAAAHGVVQQFSAQSPGPSIEHRLVGTVRAHAHIDTLSEPTTTDRLRAGAPTTRPR